MKNPFKKKVKEESEQEKASKGLIKIKIYMRFGAEIRQLKAEYTAVEKRDNYNNLISINEDFNHNEDVGFIMQDVYSSMNITLGISGMAKDKAVEKIDEVIAKCEKRVVAIGKHPELNKYANIWDESRKLRELKIYKNYLKHHSERGTYFKIEKGMRVYEYESIDGFLIPIWHGTDDLSDNPDFTTKKKITMQESANLQSYFDSRGSKKMMINALLMVLLITTAMFCVNLYAGFQLYKKSSALDEQANVGAIICTNQFAQSYATFNKVMDNAFIKQYLEKEDKSKTIPVIENPLDKLKTQ